MSVELVDAKESTALVTTTTDEEIAQQGKICLLLTHASKNNVGGMIELFNRGVRPDDSDYDKRTAMHLAASEGWLEACQLLVDNGADVNPIDRFGNSPLDDALAGGHSGVVDYLQTVDATFGSTEKRQHDLLSCVSRGDVDGASKLLQAGVSVNAANADNRTSLHLAVSDNNVEMAELLLSFKADPHAEDRFGSTPYSDMKRNKKRSGVDRMSDAFAAQMGEVHKNTPSTFLIVYSVFQVLFVVLFWAGADYKQFEAGEQANADADLLKYPVFQDIHVMIFIGFGFLMTFLRKNAFSALGWTFLVSTFVIQLHILVSHLIEPLVKGHSIEQIHLSLNSLMLGDFAAAAVLITYGGLLGKVSPLQFLTIAVIEVVVFAVNESIGLKMEITDLGGSMVVHMFGAYFGMGACIFIKQSHKANESDNSSVYHSDVFAMIGTVFLWMFWPSFNAGPSSNSMQQQRAIVNTVLSLCGSCVAAFLASYWFRRERKFNMVDIQNATLAGGVAMGTCCDMVIGPGPAVLIGAISGVLSVVGYVYVQPYLESSIGFSDTCGINNLHGMPSILGAIAGVIAIASISVSDYPPLERLAEAESYLPRVKDGDRSPSDQALTQLGFTGITLLISFFGGAIAGRLVRHLEPPDYEGDLFKDAPFWEVPDREMPYYFDKRGEIESHGAENTVHGSNTDPQVKAKIKLLENGLDEMKKKLHQRRGSVVTGSVQAAAGGGGADLEMKLMMAKLINKVDELAAVKIQ